jgi:hypothetical protein
LFKLTKVKTTASKSYIVIPPAGAIPQKEIKTIKIYLPLKVN